MSFLIPVNPGAYKSALEMCQNMAKHIQEPLKKNIKDSSPHITSIVGHYAVFDLRKAVVTASENEIVDKLVSVYRQAANSSEDTLKANKNLTTLGDKLKPIEGSLSLGARIDLKIAQRRFATGKKENFFQFLGIALKELFSIGRFFHPTIKEKARKSLKELFGEKIE